MLPNTLLALFERDLLKVIHELELYTDESNIWKVVPGSTNTAGNLALHLVGNLNTYIGKEIGQIAYVRVRDLEFSQKGISRDVLVDQLKDTLLRLKTSLPLLADQDLTKVYPLIVLEEETTFEYFLVHLFGHLNYHL
ncbi:MAG: DinB superfamily protein, partial [Pedobacter sp.]